MERKLIRARTELAGLEAHATSVRTQLVTSANELLQARQAVGDAREAAARSVSDAEVELTKRLAQVMEKPAALFAEVAIFRGFLAQTSPQPRLMHTPVSPERSYGRDRRHRSAIASRSNAR